MERGGFKISDVRKLLKKLKFSRSSLVKLEVIIYQDYNMGAFTYDVCSNLRESGSKN